MATFNANTSPSGIPRYSRRTQLLALGALLAVAVAWGSSFPLSKLVLDEVSSVDFLAVRFLIAGAVCLVIFGRQMRALSRRQRRIGFSLGLLYGVGQVLQVTGLEMVPASTSAFITDLYVVATPICAAVLIKTRIEIRVWVGCGLATVGLGLLTLNDSLSIGFGETLTIIAAVLFALHIVWLGEHVTASTALGLTGYQMLGSAVLPLVIAAPSGISVPHSGTGWSALLFTALISGVLAIAVQSWSQAILPASRAALVMSTEPVWATGFAILLLSEAITWRIVVGGAIMLAAMVIVEWRPQDATPDQTLDLRDPIAPTNHSTNSVSPIQNMGAARNLKIHPMRPSTTQSTATIPTTLRNLSTVDSSSSERQLS